MSVFSSMRAAVIFFFLTFSFPVAFSYAQDSNESALYQVSDVTVDVTADNAAHARDQAITQAQRSAFNQLLTRLGADSSLEHKLDNNSIASMVQAFEVQDERTSPVRYIGTFTVRFKPSAVRSFLGKHGATFSEVQSNPVVVLPVINNGKRQVLWEERTPWRTAWENLVGKGGLVPIIVPAGDLDDIALISANEAVNGKSEALITLMNKYQAGSVLVAILNADLSATDLKQEIRADALRFDVNGKLVGESEHFSLPAVTDSKALSAVLADGAREMKKSLENSWRESGKAPKGPLAHIRVVVPIESLADWNAIKARILRVIGINRVNVISLARNTADVDIEFYGDIPLLQSALTSQNLSLEQDPGTGGWILKGSPETVH